MRQILPVGSYGRVGRQKVNVALSFDILRVVDEEVAIETVRGGCLYLDIDHQTVVAGRDCNGLTEDMQVNARLYDNIATTILCVLYLIASNETVRSRDRPAQVLERLVFEDSGVLLVDLTLKFVRREPHNACLNRHKGPS